MPTNKQLLQYLATGIPDDETEIDLQEIAMMLLADVVASEVENPGEDLVGIELLRKEFVRPQEDICELFADFIEEANIDITSELDAVQASVRQMIRVIDANLKDDFTFEKMWAISRSAACYEILRSVGHGVSFWDDYDYEDFGQLDLPEVGWFESPYNQAYDVITKIVNYIRLQLA